MGHVLRSSPSVSLVPVSLKLFLGISCMMQ